MKPNMRSAKEARMSFRDIGVIVNITFEEKNEGSKGDEQQR